MKKENVSLYLLGGAILAGFVTAVSAYLLPHQPLVWQICAGLAVVLAVAYVWRERELILKALTQRTTLYGLNSLIMAVIALAIVVVINLITVKYDVKKDFTQNQLHSLSDQSVKVVKNLEQPVTLKAFITPMQRDEFDRIFEKYAYHSDRVKKEFVDVDQNPMEVRRYEIKRAGTIVVETEARSTKVENLTGPTDPNLEHKLTNAIIQVAKGEKKKIYFLKGHGERLISDSEPAGYSQMRQALEGSRYNVEELILLDKSEVPADAEIIVVAGPQKNFMDHELNMLRGYVKKGGKVLMLVEPDSSPELKGWLAGFGVDWHAKNTVAETNVLQRLAGGNPLTPIVTQYDGGHEITQDLRDLTIYRIATPVEKAEKVPDGVTVTSLFSTSPQSFELEFKKTLKLADHIRRGPLSLAVAVEGKVEGAATEAKKSDEQAAEGEQEKAEEKKYRMVVVGDSDFGANGLRENGMNADLFQNMLSWLAEEEDLIAIRPKPADMSSFEITEARYRVINLASVVFAPLLMFLSGIAMWLHRRRK